MVLYPCLCGFRTESRSALLRHRRSCETWQTRPNPRGIKVYRSKKTQQQGFLDGRLRCDVCGGKTQHHKPSCPFSESEASRAEMVAKAGISPQHWEWVLRVLQRRYQTRG
jgi:hypothetical protein